MLLLALLVMLSVMLELVFCLVDSLVGKFCFPVKVSDGTLFLDRRKFANSATAKLVWLHSVITVPFLEICGMWLPSIQRGC